MKKLKLGLLCLLAGVVLTACEKKIDDPNNQNNPGVVDNPVIDTLSGKVYTETLSDINFSMDMVCVQGGTFMMSCSYEHEKDEPTQTTLSSYHIGKYEITQAQWKAVMGTTIEKQRDWASEGERYKEELYGVGDDYPMYYVSWREAQEFCRKLSQKTGKNYALPSEAQWEFAARGGNKSKGYKYSGSNNVNDVAWCYDNSYSLDSDHPDYGSHVVGTKAPNEIGIYDMSGNVWELCEDWLPSRGEYHSYYHNRVSRGGSWGIGDNHNYGCAVSEYCGYLPDSRYGNKGFRVVCLP